MCQKAKQKHWQIVGKATRSVRHALGQAPIQCNAPAAVARRFAAQTFKNNAERSRLLACRRSVRRLRQLAGACVGPSAKQAPNEKPFIT